MQQSNIFKSFSKKLDIECDALTKLSFQECIFDKDINDNIIKVCNCTEVIHWESSVYLYLLDKQIALPTTIIDKTIYYQTYDKISLYKWIRDNVKNTSLLKCIINELFGFVNKFRQYNFLHGNLHVHNIFLDSNKNNGKIYVIDLCNSFLLDNPINKVCFNSYDKVNYKRSSFLGETHNKDKSILFEYWDFFTLYKSLKLVLNKTLNCYLEALLTNYVKQDILNDFLKRYGYVNLNSQIKYKI